MYRIESEDVEREKGESNELGGDTAFPVSRNYLIQ
jgi:hypothetical protein